MQYPHLEALHDVGAVPYEETLGPRTNKENVLEAYGFAKGSNPAEFVAFDYAGPDPSDVKGYLEQKVADGKYSALLFRDGKWESMGGCPVVYVMEHSDIDQKLLFDKNGQITQISSDGEVFSPSESTKLNTYTRKHSIGMQLEGFENYDKPLDVSLGGGFRLQIDELTYQEGKPFLTMSAYFSFNDYGSRVLAKENEDDAQVPMANKSFRVPIVGGELEFAAKDIEQSEVTTANDAMDLVLSELFTNDGKAISALARDLLTVRPAMQVHQFEGIYGVTEENGVSAEVIDFDGLDTFDLSDGIAEYSPLERLVGGQLLQSGYVKELDRGSRVAYFQQLDQLRSATDKLDENEGISEAVRSMALQHPGEDMTAYANRLHAYGRLARSIGYCGLEWTSTANKDVMRAEANGWTITKVSVGGYESAFAERDGKIAHVKNAKEIYDLTKQMLGSDMLRLYVSLSREGD